MKAPQIIAGVVRKHRRDPLIRGDGISAQECEELCAEEFEPGTEEYGTCVEECLEGG